MTVAKLIAQPVAASCPGLITVANIVAVLSTCTDRLDGRVAETIAEAAEVQKETAMMRMSCLDSNFKISCSRFHRDLLGTMY